MPHYFFKEKYNNKEGSDFENSLKDNLGYNLKFSERFNHSYLWFQLFEVESFNMKCKLNDEVEDKILHPLIELFKNELKPINSPSYTCDLFDLMTMVERLESGIFGVITVPSDDEPSVEDYRFLDKALFYASGIESLFEINNPDNKLKKYLMKVLIDLHENRKK